MVVSLIWINFLLQATLDLDRKTSVAFVGVDCLGVACMGVSIKDVSCIDMAACVLLIEIPAVEDWNTVINGPILDVTQSCNLFNLENSSNNKAATKLSILSSQQS